MAVTSLTSILYMVCPQKLRFEFLPQVINNSNSAKMFPVIFSQFLLFVFSNVVEKGGKLQRSASEGTHENEGTG